MRWGLIDKIITFLLSELPTNETRTVILCSVIEKCKIHIQFFSVIYFTSVSDSDNFLNEKTLFQKK